LWGTDWTRAFAVVNYEQGVEPFLKTDRLSDTKRAMLPSLFQGSLVAYSNRPAVNRPRTAGKSAPRPAVTLGSFTPRYEIS